MLGIGFKDSLASTAVHLVRASSSVNDVRLDGSCPLNTALRLPPRESSCPHNPHTWSSEMPDSSEDPYDLVAQISLRYFNGMQPAGAYHT